MRKVSLQGVSSWRARMGHVYLITFRRIKGKFIHLNLKLIGFQQHVTRVAFKWFARNPSGTGRAFWTTTCSYAAVAYCMYVRTVYTYKRDWERAETRKEWASSMFEYLLGCPMFELRWCHTNGWANCHQPRNTNTLSCLTRARIALA